MGTKFFSRFVSGVALSLATLVAVPALAAEGDAPKAAEAGKDAKFPMPAGEFRAKVTVRVDKAKERLESRAAKLSAEQAKEMRSRFEANLAKIKVEVDRVTADGTVTKDEAKDVRRVTRALRGHHGKGHGGKHDGGKQERGKR